MWFSFGSRWNNDSHFSVFMFFREESLGNPRLFVFVCSETVTTEELIKKFSSPRSKISFIYFYVSVVSSELCTKPQRQFCLFKSCCFESFDFLLSFDTSLIFRAKYYLRYHKKCDDLSVRHATYQFLSDTTDRKWPRSGCSCVT